MKYIVLPLLFIAGLGLAQSGEKALDELRITDRVIEEATPIVEESGVPEAQQHLRDAEAIQREAWQLYEQQEFLRVLSRTRSARGHARRAMELARIDPRRVEDEIRKTGEFIAEHRQLVIRSGIRQAIELGKIAEAELEGARHAFHGRRYRLAIKLTQASRLHAHKAVEMVKRHGSPERLRKELERTDMLLEKAGARVEGLETPGIERILELLERARHLQAEAYDAYRAGQPLRSVKLTLAARDLLMRGWEMARGKGNPELVEQALEETDRLLEEWQDFIRSEGDDEARAMLDRALEHQRKARGFHEQGALRAAYGETTLARRLLQRAIEMAQSEPVPGPGREEPAGQ